MRHFFLFVILASVIFFGCKKETNNSNNTVNSTDSFAGVIDSVIVYSSDSGNVSAGYAGGLRFSYDNKKRVTKMEAQGRYYNFLYNDNSGSPYMITDSSYSINAQFASIYNYLVFYDASGRKITDTVSDYYTVDNTNTITHSPVTIKARHFNYQPTYIAMKINNNAFYDDTTYINSYGDIPNYTLFSPGTERNIISGYYPDENPFHHLNIEPAFLDITTLFHLQTFFPMDIDLFQPVHLFNTLIGSNDLVYRYYGDEIGYIHCSYDKDALGRINKLVLSTAFFKKSDLSPYGGRTFINLKFYYHS
ncbi:MAG: hypothetical protein ABI402_15600 [Ferruginibacter sp.]